MTSNQDSKEKEIRIPMTGIKVMKELSLDAPMMLYLASEEKLMPFQPGIPAHFFKKTMLDQRHLNEQVSNWWYWKSDIEAFKLEHKEFLEKIRLENAITLVESQKQGPSESEDSVSTGKNGGEQSKKRRSRSSDDREIAIMLAKKYLDQHRAKKDPYSCHDAAVVISNTLGEWDLRTIKGWIKPYFPDEAKQPGRPPKEKVKK